MKQHLTATFIEYICVIVFCSPRTTFVADANTLTLAQSVIVHHSISSVSAASDTTSSRFIILVPGLQEPPAANLLLELISAHIEFLCFVWSECLIRCDTYT